PSRILLGSCPTTQGRHDHERSRAGRLWTVGTLVLGLTAVARDRSSGSGLQSASLFGVVLARLKQLHGAVRHDGRDCMLVDKLRMPVAAQQNAEVVEPVHDALKLDAVDEKYCESRFLLSNVIEEGILQILSAVSHVLLFPICPTASDAIEPVRLLGSRRRSKVPTSLGRRTLFVRAESPAKHHRILVRFEHRFLALLDRGRFRFLTIR